MSFIDICWLVFKIVGFIGLAFAFMGCVAKLILKHREKKYGFSLKGKDD